MLVVGPTGLDVLISWSWGHGIYQAAGPRQWHLDWSTYSLWRCILMGSQKSPTLGLDLDVLISVPRSRVLPSCRAKAMAYVEWSIYSLWRCILNLDGLPKISQERKSEARRLHFSHIILKIRCGTLDIWITNLGFAFLCIYISGATADLSQSNLQKFLADR